MKYDPTPQEPDSEDEEIEFSFNSHDLQYSIHGLKRVHFSAKEKTPDTFSVDITLFDIFDFNQIKLKFPPPDYADLRKLWKQIYTFGKEFINNVWEVGEQNGLVNNFEIQFHLSETIKLHHE